MKINEKTLIAYAISPSPPDKEGLLLKKGEVNKGFQKRWFALKGNLLFYYEKKGDKEPVGVIVLEDCTIECFDSGDGFSFMINFPGSHSRTYILSADSQEEMESWMKALSCSSYDYMKLLVSDLQRKLDEVNKDETSKLVHMGDRASRMVSRTYSDAFSPKMEGVDTAEEALISFGDNSSASGTGSQNSTPMERFNPFDPPSSKGVVNGGQPVLAPPPVASMRNAHQMRKAQSLPDRHHKPRTFSEMHEEFGQLIKDRLKQSTLAETDSKPKASPRNQPKSLSLNLPTNT
ncbi:PH domain-containing protein DDB_G0275795-like [Liolophura sinensis]|uniref:PH domain-containing protein DDB_G0275795-like n=1 Tax=Liolophura sinensis TaxID=3198878 RepID=UPI003158926D